MTAKVLKYSIRFMYKANTYGYVHRTILYSYSYKIFGKQSRLKNFYKNFDYLTFV